MATTRSGRVEGVRDRGVDVFRGIPYARSPAGKLRFRPPEPAESWQGVRPAARPRPAAPQGPALLPLLGRLIGPGGAGQSEDCLYLNVWTPAADRRRRPVLFWIHGGAFVMGSGATPLYSGRRLARRGDVVVVTINYRLGALGFLSLGELMPGVGDAPSNAGLLDQIAALAWVRDNIEEFGGGPENVTVFGESAGAMSVATLLGTSSARGLFHRAILQSGAAHNVSSREHAATVADAFLRRLGLDALDAGALERVSLSSILRTQREVTLELGLRLGSLPWQPSVDRDVLPEPPLATIGRGEGSRVPVVIGTNRDEWRLFMLGDRRVRNMDEAGLRRRLDRTLPGTGPERVERAIETYRATRDPASSPADLWAAIQTDRIFRYPAARLAELHAPHAPAFAYRFQWAPPLARNRVGAAHGIEIPFVFGTIREPLLRPVFGLGPRARELSQRMQQAWLEFARSGAPAHAGLPDWTPYEPEERRTQVLGPRCRVESSPGEPERLFWAEMLAS